MAPSVSEAIAARHSVRAYAPDPLSQAEIEALLEAGRNAPSSLNSQPWRFKVVTAEADRQWFATSAASRKQSWLAAAPAIIVCCADLAGYVRDSQASAFFYKENKLIEGEPMAGIEKYVAREAEAAEMAKFGAGAMNVALAVSFMMLRAVEMGLGTCWVGMFDEQNIKNRFGLGPDLRVVCLLAVGRPAEASVPPRKRKALAEIVLP
ncbi:nitroreductase [Desulfovibrio sp. X2]|uniref:nitroreductase family protein n=1 Tax=Desulfovibrio sp. X2 TaxID=941449 RepID=UPI000358DDE4|nr:nitroreductase family protein [Desulfovibrio sp. X2]EPR44313.1 nitroreductase [Desulfovibrio sp. X2]